MPTPERKEVLLYEDIKILWNDTDRVQDRYVREVKMEMVLGANSMTEGIGLKLVNLKAKERRKL